MIVKRRGVRRWGLFFLKDAERQMLTTRIHDGFGRLQTIQSTAGTTVVSGHAYTYDDAHRRTKITLEDGNHWNIDSANGYNGRGEVIKAYKHYATDNQRFRGRTYEYSYDDIGNRTSAKSGGDTTGSSGSLREVSYTADGANQYTSLSNPNSIDVTGESNGTVTVDLGGQSQTVTKQGSYFRSSVSVTAGSSQQGMQLVSLNSGEEDGKLYFPRQTEILDYDGDGNLSSDGRWDYLLWDEDNRLIQMRTRPLSVSGINPATEFQNVHWLKFTYDYMGRRIKKEVLRWNAVSEDYEQLSVRNTAANWLSEKTELYLYDGWNCVAILDGGDSQAFVWGPDISGTSQGAGGVGGLLFRFDLAATYSVLGGTAVASDGNGNVTAIVEANNGLGTVQAKYEYDPFGNIIRASGIHAETNPFRFSSKFTDDETGLVYYGYRYYDPPRGRWLSRDPIGGTRWTAVVRVRRE